MAPTFVYNADAPKEPIDEIHLKVVMLFDGTANNRINMMIRKKYHQIEEGKGLTISKDNEKVYCSLGIERTYKNLWRKKQDRTDNNFANDFSNIARLSFSTEPKKYTIYIEGIDTEDREDDFLFEQAFGTGETGVIA
ncbi:hypothetical protein [Riemerella columbipharyngis]|uniref:Uncharacterized protein n=1 Tax=Riemerella columbipharyngis TaxID=1071918 RepID=A0A1G7E7I8_9FLAO|nr:hypothetical protein [Riemerella columbipharyngis]SDE59642.1 hypothetical protein SAMN05421544_11452 [Riemerella columbipharyngis]